jgi:dethiobiotin synthetase
MRIVVVGSGTGVGKTHVACALLRAFVEAGREALGLKPVETGVAEGRAGDAERLGEAARRPPVAPRYAFEPAVSPHLAARMAGTGIDVAAIAQWVDDHSCPLQVVESAGGLLSPLSFGVTNLDLLCALLPAAVVVVAVDRLGALHDVAAVNHVLAGRAIEPAAVCLSAPATPDSATGSNTAELAALGVGEAMAFPRAAPDAPASQSAARELALRLG